MSKSDQTENSAITPSDDADTPNASGRVEVTAADLPLHCPMPGKRLWDSHPRVYLPIENSAEETCPYCGTVFVLKELPKSAQ